MKKKGFTLLELMITIAVMTVLASVVGSKLGKQLIKVKNAKGIQLISTWKSSNILYYSDKGYYPSIDDGFGNSFIEPLVGLALYVDKSTLSKTMLGASNDIATIVVGYAETGGLNKDEVILTYSLLNNEGIINVSGGSMKASGATPEENWNKY